MADMIKVRLLRAYLWITEEGSEVSYGPGDVEIPKAMAEGLQREKVDLGLPSLALAQTGEGDVHPKIFAQRESEASARSVKAASALAKRFGLEENEDALSIKGVTADEQQVLRNEALADFLEGLLKATPDDVDSLVGNAARQTEEAVGQRLKEAAKQGRDALLAVIEELPGIGPKSIEAIGNALGEMPPTEPTLTAISGEGLTVDSSALSAATTPSGENGTATNKPVDSTDTSGASLDATG